MNPRLPAAPLAAAALLLSACTGLRKVPFVYGSPDFNGGSAHEAVLPGRDPQALAERLSALAAARGLRVSDRTCDRDRCRLVLDGPVNELTKNFQLPRTSKPAARPSAKSRPTRAGEELDMAMAGLELAAALTGGGKEATETTTLRARFSSRYFARITRAENGVRLELAGVPVQNGHMSCPPAVAERFTDCAPPPFPVLGEDTPAEAMRRHWGVDISGKTEAAAISGLLKELAD